MKIAQLAEQTIQEMDRVYKDIVRHHITSSSISETMNKEVHEGLLQGSSSGAGESGDHSDQARLVTYDFSGVEGVPDLNVFDFFDSDFHLDEVDAAFINNMAMTFSPAVHSEVSIQESI